MRPSWVGRSGYRDVECLSGACGADGRRHLAGRLSSLSEAVNRNTYVPSELNDAVVSTAAGSAKDTVPGPLTFDHVVDVDTAAGGSGCPSSPTVLSKRRHLRQRDRHVRTRVHHRRPVASS